MSSDDEHFEDTYDSIAEEEATEPLEAEGAAAIQSTMPGDENKPPKSIFKALTTHLSLLKGRVAELDTYLDNRGARQTVDDREVDTIELEAVLDFGTLGTIFWNPWNQFSEPMEPTCEKKHFGSTYIMNTSYQKVSATLFLILHT